MIGTTGRNCRMRSDQIGDCKTASHWIMHSRSGTFALLAGHIVQPRNKPQHTERRRMVGVCYWCLLLMSAAGVRCNTRPTRYCYPL